jgi:hypothetical protein|tara:strand:+ start:182 stop:904 length:723 start_codon:yes stop_codon:yes gene_type:complete
MNEVNIEGQVLEDTGLNEELGYEDVPVADHVVSESETHQVDWENETRKFQSMYDKQKSENHKMKQDMQYIANNIKQTQSDVNKKPSLPEDEFNPWDAYYKPESESYKFRQQKEHEVVNRAIGQQNAQMQEQMLINNTMNDLRGIHKMTESEVSEFMDWSTDPGSSMTLDTLVDVFKSRNQQSAVLPSGEPTPDSFQAVKAAREAPRTAGVLQGQEANQPKSEKDAMWESVMNAGSRSNVL